MSKGQPNGCPLMRSLHFKLNHIVNMKFNEIKNTELCALQIYQKAIENDSATVVFSQITNPLEGGKRK